MVKLKNMSDFSVYSYPQDIKDIHFILLPIKQLPTYLHLFIFSLIFFQKANSIYTPFGPLRIVCQLCGRTKRFHPWKKLPSISIIQQLKFKTSLRHLRMERHDLSLFQYFSIDAILVMSKILGLQMITIVIDLKRMYNVQRTTGKRN